MTYKTLPLRGALFAVLATLALTELAQAKTYDVEIRGSLVTTKNEVKSSKLAPPAQDWFSYGSDEARVGQVKIATFVRNSEGVLVPAPAPLNMLDGTFSINSKDSAQMNSVRVTGLVSVAQVNGQYLLLKQLSATSNTGNVSSDKTPVSYDLTKIAANQYKLSDKALDKMSERGRAKMNKAMKEIMASAKLTWHDDFKAIGTHSFEESRNAPVITVDKNQLTESNGKVELSVVQPAQITLPDLVNVKL